MPDILIRGMEMPTMEQTYKTLIVSYDGKVYEGVHPQPTAKKKEPIAEAVELPPHGDLIEAEPIKKFITDGLNSGEFGHDTIEVLTEIEYAPVIVPAERREG